MARNWMHKHATKKPLPAFVVARIKYGLERRKEEQGADGSQDSSHELSRGSLASFVHPTEAIRKEVGLSSSGSRSWRNGYQC